MLHSDSPPVHFVTGAAPESRPDLRTAPPMPDNYLPTEREQTFLASVEDPRYDRQSINGLAPFLSERAPEDVLNFYSKE